MYLIDWLCFLNFEKWLFVDVLCIPEVQSYWVTKAICSRGAPYVACVGPSVVLGWLLWVVW